MKKWLVIAFVMTLATAALADTVTLKLVGTPYGQIGPYDMKVNGTVQQLVCGSDLHFITMNESWTAQVYDINTIGSNPYFTTDALKWNLASLFADLLLLHPGDAGLQTDVWIALGLAQPSAVYDGVYAPGVLAWFGAHQNYQTTDLFYIPVKVDGDYQGYYNLGLPQPFIGVPEPSSLMLFGSGLMLAARVVRRRSRV